MMIGFSLTTYNAPYISDSTAFSLSLPDVQMSVKYQRLLRCENVTMFYSEILHSVSVSCSD